MESEHESERPKTEEVLDSVVGMLDRMDLRQRVFEDEMRRDIGGVKSDVSFLKGDVSDLKADVAELKTDVRRLDAKLDDIAETLTETVQDHEVRLVALEVKG